MRELSLAAGQLDNVRRALALRGIEVPRTDRGRKIIESKGVNLRLEEKFLVAKTDEEIEAALNDVDLSFYGYDATKSMEERLVVSVTDVVKIAGRPYGLGRSLRVALAKLEGKVPVATFIGGYGKDGRPGYTHVIAMRHLPLAISVLNAGVLRDIAEDWTK